MTRAEHNALSRAYSRYDRLTVYGCAHAGRTFDEPKMMTAYGVYRALLHKTFPDQWSLLA